jgi:hypothetical protein
VGGVIGEHIAGLDLKDGGEFGACVCLFWGA